MTNTTTPAVDLDAVITRWNTVNDGTTCDGEHIAALQASADDVPYLAREVHRLRNLVGDESAGGPVWASCSRAEAIRQADANHEAYMDLFRQREDLLVQFHARGEQLEATSRELAELTSAVAKLIRWADRTLGRHALNYGNSFIRNEIVGFVGYAVPGTPAWLPLGTDPAPRGPLYSAIDWMLWHHGVDGKLREHAAGVMVCALQPYYREQILDLIEARKAQRGALPHERYAQLQAELEQIRVDRQLLAAAHAVLTTITDQGLSHYDAPETPGGQLYDRAVDLVARIADELGGPVAEANLGPNLREQIAGLTARLAVLDRDEEAAVGRVVDAARAWRSRILADPRLWVDRHDAALIAAVDELPAPARITATAAPEAERA